MIPQVVHRLWMGAPPPQDYVDNAATWLEHNPGWTVKEWDEASILALGLKNQRLWDEASEQSSRLVPRMRSDIARYEILWRYGGLYADHDFRCLQPIGPHIADLDCFAVQEKPGLIANGLLGCTKGHPFMRSLIDGLPASVDSRKGQQVWQVTGPGYITRMAKEHEGLSVLPKAKFLPYHYSEKRQAGPQAVLEHTWGSARQQVSVIIPWRQSGRERRCALEAVLERYRTHRDWQVVVAEAPAGKFCKAAAVNEGIRRSFGDVIVVADADLLCDGVEEAVELVRKRPGWVMPYTLLHRMNTEATKRVLLGEDPKAVMVDRSLLDGFTAPYPGVIGGGIVVLSRNLAEKVPMDERFVGWGGEDISWGLALQTFAGRPRRVNADLYHLWHPPAERISKDRGSEENFELYRRYHRASGNRTKMKQLLAGR